MCKLNHVTSFLAVATSSLNCFFDVLYGCPVVKYEVAENVIKATED